MTFGHGVFRLREPETPVRELLQPLRQPQPAGCSHSPATKHSRSYLLKKGCRQVIDWKGIY